MRPLSLSYLFVVAGVLTVSFLTVDALRCYACNSGKNANCVDLSERCTHNIDCRADFIAICSQMENACAVVYGKDSQVWRGCYNEPRRTTVSNDQHCEMRDGVRTCVCQVDMCNASSNMTATAFSLLSAFLLLSNVFTFAF